MGELAGFNYREVTRRLRALGFGFDRTAKGSHEIWRHSDGRRTTVPHHPGDVPEGTLRAILRAASLTAEQFLST
ncbi:MAG: type II toxin-antitoxin system HicA family toxin [Proteobacteria bacterium]|jgi:predicted RNA binding protein YcfA (HicA-like mRNA interferase family)|nr:type II toxin-antitoxin system HicA family toxin [Pseudomonadota bacterium]